MRLDALPADGWKGKPPKWPLAERVATPAPDDEDAVVVRAEIKRIRTREAAMWRWVWSLPQAAAWSQSGEQWRIHSVAMWVRTAVICEESTATAADKNSLHRFADQIGLTPAGLIHNGWASGVPHSGVARFV